MKISINKKVDSLYFSGGADIFTASKNYIHCVFVKKWIRFCQFNIRCTIGNVLSPANNLNPFHRHEHSLLL